MYCKLVDQFRYNGNAEPQNSNCFVFRMPQGQDLKQNVFRFFFSFHYAICYKNFYGIIKSHSKQSLSVNLDKVLGLKQPTAQQCVASKVNYKLTGTAVLISPELNSSNVFCQLKKNLSCSFLIYSYLYRETMTANMLSNYSFSCLICCALFQ